tara:strand:- start:26695 stop:27831 length:1137 start_codon:yes stop_codon:yes gene_type:complete
MAGKDKLSKEVEEQIQSLASDVYIQIEEKLTQLICTAMPKEPAKQISIKQSPDYLALQANYQTSQNALAENNKKLSEQTHQLEQVFSVQNQKLQSQIASNEKKLLEQRQEISQLNNRLAVFSMQEEALIEHLNTVEQQRDNSDNTLQKAEISFKKTEELHTNSSIEQKNQIKELTQKLATAVIDLDNTQAQYQQQTTLFKQESEQKATQLSKRLQQFKIAEEDQQKIVADQQAQLVDLDEKVKKKTIEAKNANQLINKLNNEKSQIKQQLADTKENDVQLKELQQAQEVSSLKSQVTLAQEGQENILNRFNATREKQEKDNDQIRETIKYLRDENNDMITQNNRQKKAFIEQISELEHKLTEYRLKFEYAQKQLTQNS